MFSKRDFFTSFMTPFAKRSYGPDLFRKGFPALDVEPRVKVIEIWKFDLTSRLLSTRLGTTRGNLGIVGY